MTAREISRVEGPVGTSDEEVEAAARAVWARLVDDTGWEPWEIAPSYVRDHFREDAKIALEAAASVAVPGAREAIDARDEIEAAYDAWVPPVELRAVPTLEAFKAGYRAASVAVPGAREADDEEILRLLARHGTPTMHGNPTTCTCWQDARDALRSLRQAGFDVAASHPSVREALEGT